MADSAVPLSKAALRGAAGLHSEGWHLGSLGSPLLAHSSPCCHPVELRRSKSGAMAVLSEGLIPGQVPHPTPKGIALLPYLLFSCTQKEATQWRCC